jgi:hypothetical protein
MIESKKLYTNEKLCRLKITDQPYCFECPDVMETINHLIYECPRSQECYRTLEEIKIKSTHIIDKNKEINLNSLVKHFIYTKRNEPYHLNLLESMLNNRLNDLNHINLFLTKLSKNSS